MWHNNQSMAVWMLLEILFLLKVVIEKAFVLNLTNVNRSSDFSGELVFNLARLGSANVW